MTNPKKTIRKGVFRGIKFELYAIEATPDNDRYYVCIGGIIVCTGLTQQQALSEWEWAIRDVYS